MGRSRTIIKTNHGSDHQYFGDKDHNGRLCDFILATQNRIRNIDNRQAPVNKVEEIQRKKIIRTFLLFLKCFDLDGDLHGAQSPLELVAISIVAAEEDDDVRCLMRRLTMFMMAMVMIMMTMIVAIMIMVNYLCRVNVLSL